LVVVGSVGVVEVDFGTVGLARERTDERGGAFLEVVLAGGFAA
jgi:hypothetical protein